MVGIVIGILTGIGLVFILKKDLFKPIEIKPDDSSKEWIFPNLVTFVVLIFCVFAELIIVAIVSEIRADNRICWLFIQMLKNGLLVVPIILLTSWIYTKMVRARDLDYSIAYDETLKKVYFTMACIVACLMMIGMCWEQFLGQNYEGAELFVSRIVMWVLNTICIWAGFGIMGKGRLEIEADKEEKPSFMQKIQLNRGYYIAFFGTGGIALVLLAIVALMEELQAPVMEFGIALTIPLMLYSIYFVLRYCPSEKRSKKQLVKNFYKLVKAESGQVSGRYMKQKYDLKKENRKIMLFISDEDIIWKKAGKDNRDKMSHLFGTD